MAANGTVDDDIVQHPTLPIITNGDAKPEIQNKLEVNSYERTPDEFFRTIFYFSGMGTVIGKALEEGVHVEERQRGKGIDVDLLPEHVRNGKLHVEEYPLVVRCRDQVHNIMDELANLRTLMEDVPTYRQNSDPSVYRPTIGLADVKLDEPIHGSKYFTATRMNNPQE